MARHANVVRIGDELAVFWRDFGRANAEANVYVARFDVRSETWLDSRLIQVASHTTPGVTRAPDGHLYLASPEGAYRRLRLRRATAFDGPWDDIGVHAIEWLSFDPQPAERTKVSLEFVPLRSGLESVFDDETGQLHLYWTRQDVDSTERSEWFLERAQLTGYIGPADNQLGDWLVRRDGLPDRPRPGHSVATAMRGADVVAVYSAVNWDPLDGLPGGALRAPRYVPYAFGMVPGYEGLLDHDDAAVIATRMCRALWWIVDRQQADCRCETGQACDTDVAPLVLEEPLCEPE